ncbi:hypothetical protein [Thermococcus nautili]|uniref:hypothetical protein n=1 Tax=Thermococcus nautili TaxID=195522 RepID=UPI002555D58B|nr:hypothetical protein [Thermococcus nautili]
MLGRAKGYIYIFDRNGLDFRVFPVEFDKGLFRRFLRRAERVIDAVEELESGSFRAGFRRLEERVGCATAVHTGLFAPRLAGRG